MPQGRQGRVSSHISNIAKTQIQQLCNLTVDTTAKIR